MSNKWAPNQLGTASAATTVPGQARRFGLAYDLSNAQWTSSAEFVQFAHDTMVAQQARAIAAAQGQVPANLHDQEFYAAQQHYKEQQGASNFNQVAHGVSNFIQTPSLLFGHVGLGYDTDNAYEQYAKAGGLLTKDEFASFDSDTQNWLLTQATGGGVIKRGVEAVPYSAPVMTALGNAYRGLNAGLIMFDARPEVLGQPDANPFKTFIDPHWWGSDNWSAAWRETQSRSLGNIIVDSTLNDKGVPQSKLDQWKKDNSIYQLTSAGTEFAAGWYMDAGVFAGKAIGGTSRILHGEAPLNEGGSLYTGVKQVLADEPIEGVNPFVKPLVKPRANAISKRWDDLKLYGQNTNLEEFGNLGMWDNRAVDGQPLAAAFHIAANSENPELWDLTQRAAWGDPKAYAKIAWMEKVAPEDLKAFNPESQNFLNAIQATRTKAEALTDEVERMQKVRDANGPVGGGDYTFYNWSLDNSIAAKQADIEAANNLLSKYSDYGDWLGLMTQGEKAKAQGLLAQVYVPRAKLWSAVERRSGDGVRHTYMPNAFAPVAKVVSSATRATWIEKANGINMHDLNSGDMSLRRQARQYNHLMGYEIGDGLDEALNSWHRAATPTDRAEVVRAFEARHLIDAAAQSLGVERQHIQALYEHAVKQQNMMADAFARAGDGTIYSSAPTLGERVADPESGVKLISRDPDTKMVTLEFMDNGKSFKAQVPQESLTQKPLGPIDKTQTVDYYQPIDTREFYYALKRNPELLETMNASGIKTAEAWTMNSIDTVGTTLNRIWKPLQLFRLGWPMRVLMDEQARGLAVLGIPDWLVNYGGAYAHSGYNALTAIGRHPAMARHFGINRDINMGQGGIRMDDLQDGDAIAHDQEVVRSPKIPESFVQKPDRRRLGAIGDHIGNFSTWRSAELKRLAWLNAWRSAEQKGGEALEAFRASLARNGNPIESSVLGGAAKPFHPTTRAVDNFISDERGGAAAQGSLGGPENVRVYDPVSGKEIKSGYVIPMPHTAHKIRLNKGESNIYNGGPEYWYERHHEMLATPGHRMVIDQDGNLMVGRLFDSTERKRAGHYLEFINGSKLWNLRNGAWHYIEQPGDSPMMEAARREFAYGHEEGYLPGDAPIENSSGTAVYHGTDRDLPEQLLNRYDVQMANGQMLGRGLYADTKPELAETYGSNLYVVKNSRTGRRERQWEADEEMKPTHVEGLLRFAEERIPDDILGQRELAKMRRDLLSPTYNWETWGGSGSNPLTVQRAGKRTWANYYEHLDATGRVEAKDIVTDYLEEVHNVGIIHHKGGTSYGSPHDVHIFLHPEDLELKPGYGPTGRFHNLIEWLDNSSSLENPVPQNRMIRRRSPSPEETAAENANIDQWLASARGDREANAAYMRENNPQFDFLDQEIDNVQNRVYRALMKRREEGKKWTYEVSSDGTRVARRGAYQGVDGELFHALITSRKAFDELSDGHGRMTSLLRRQTVGMKSYSPPVFTDKALTPGTKEYKAAVEYFTRWGDMVNRQIRHSPVWSKMLDGWSDERIAHWLDHEPEGQQVRLDSQVNPTEPSAVWVNEHRAKLDYYVPNKALQRRLLDHRVEPSELRKYVHNDDLPTVFGPDIEVMDRRVGLGRTLSYIGDTMWHSLGTVPVDRLSRSPFAKAMYDMKMKSLIHSTNSKWLDDRMIARFEDQSQKFAMGQVRKHLWDLTDQTNFTDALRFIAPFWGAQQEAILKWGRIISDRPETVARFFVGQRAAYNNFAVVDKDGNPVNRAPHIGEGLMGLGYNPEDRVVIKLPGFMKQGPLRYIGATGIPVGSANTVLQGEMPLLPGPGPIVTIPADKFLRHFSDTYGVQENQNFLYRWMFPIGRPTKGGLAGVLQQLEPGYMKRVTSLAGGDDDTAYANMYTNIYREMSLDNKDRGLPPPSPEDVAKATKMLWGVRIFAGLTMPVQTEFMPEHQIWLDRVHEYQRKYGAAYYDKFIEKYGLAAAKYVTSSSNSIIDIPPTSQGMEDWSANKKLIAKYPEWGGAIISPQAYQGDFNSDAYNAQFQINLGPGDNRKLRSLQSANERLAQSNVKAGWYQYRQFNSQITNALRDLGAHSLQQTSIPGVYALAQAKQAWVSRLSHQNPDWRADYDNYSQDIYSRVYNLSQFAFNPEFDNRPDFQGVRQYLEYRRQATDLLDAIGAQGGSRSMQTQATVNTAVRQWFYDRVGKLIQDNPAFGEFYSHYLDSDTLEQGSGGYVDASGN